MQHVTNVLVFRLESRNELFLWNYRYAVRSYSIIQSICLRRPTLSRILIENLGPIKSFEQDVDENLMILIDEQASGKSRTQR